MENKRKEIIIHEIIYWKSHRLLPSEYCDFLLALYTEGDNPIESKLTNWKETASFGLLVLALPLSLMITYFTDFDLRLQIAIILFWLIFLGINIYFLSRKKSFYFHYSVMIFCFVFFVSSIGFLSEWTTSFWVNLGIIGNLVMWLGIGRMTKKHIYLYLALVVLFLWVFMLFIVN